MLELPSFTLRAKEASGMCCEAQHVCKRGECRAVTRNVTKGGISHADTCGQV